jgi:hypothetical protein
MFVCFAFCVNIKANEKTQWTRCHQKGISFLSLPVLQHFLAVNPNHVSPGEVWTCCTKTEGHSAKTSGSAPDPLQTTPNRVPVEMARMTPPVSMLGGILHQLAKGKR